MKMWNLVRRGQRIYVRAGHVGGPLHWLPVRDLRAFADSLHDMADEIEREQREGGDR